MGDFLWTDFVNYEKNAVSQGTGKWMLILLLLAGGGGDAMAKVFAMFGSKPLEETFLVYTFLSALVLCLILVLYKKERLQPLALVYGVIVGVPNFFSARVLLKAVSVLPAVVVYPTFSVGTMLLVTLAGVLVFRERLRKKQWVALTVILAALILLNI